MISHPKKGDSCSSTLIKYVFQLIFSLGFTVQAEDDKQKDRISAKNGLESYCFNMKTTIEDEKVKDKISEEDRKRINDKCEEAIKWLDANQLAEVQ